METRANEKKQNKRAHDNGMNWTTRLILQTLGKALKTASPSYLLGKVELRQALVGSLRCKESHAEVIVNTMENLGALRFEFCKDGHSESTLRWIPCF